MPQAHRNLARLSPSGSGSELAKLSSVLSVNVDSVFKYKCLHTNPSVCAKTSNCSFLPPDISSVRLLAYRKLRPRLARSSSCAVHKKSPEESAFCITSSARAQPAWPQLSCVNEPILFLVSVLSWLPRQPQPGFQDQAMQATTHS